MSSRTDYDTLEPKARASLRREELILEVTESLSRALDEQGLTQSKLARRMGKSPAFVSQILAGGRNLTLSTIAQVAEALGGRVEVRIVRQSEGKAQRPRSRELSDPAETSRETARASTRPRFPDGPRGVRVRAVG
jgi:transcriptional regulator with XRE-family HTH domain